MLLASHSETFLVHNDQNIPTVGTTVSLYMLMGENHARDAQCSPSLIHAGSTEVAKTTVVDLSVRITSLLDVVFHRWNRSQTAFCRAC